MSLLEVDNPILHRDLIMKSIISLFLQCLLVFLFKSDSEELEEFGSIEINGSRIACAFLLHLIIKPEISASLNLIQFQIQRNKQLTSQQTRDRLLHEFWAFSMALMKLIGGMLTEYISMVIIVQSTSIDDVIKDFIALEIIANIDNIIAETVSEE